MTTLEVLDNLFFCQRGYLSANHLAWRGERPVLIDTGYLAHQEHTLELLAGLGLDLARVGLIVSTHAHCDHVGANRRIQGLSGCEIAMHPLGRHFINTRDDWATWWRYYHQDAEFFTCGRGLADGEILEVGPHRFQVIHTPGHASDGLALYHPGERLLISSDALWGSDLAVVTERVEGSAAVWRWLETLERLAGMEVRLVLPGHGPAFGDFPRALSRARERLRRYLADRRELGRDQLRRIVVYTLLMRGPLGSEDLLARLEATPWFLETCRLYFPGLEPRGLLLSALEALAAKGATAEADGRLVAMVPA